MKESVVIIGGGLGGLFSGAILAKEGLDVTVIEKNVIIGGGIQSFRRYGVLFDTGMHIIGGMQKDGNIRRICEYIGIWEDVHTRDTDRENMDRIFFFEDGRSYHIASGRVGFVDSLSEYFPDQRENLEAYVAALYKLSDEVDLFYLRPSSEYMQVHSDEFQMAADKFIAKYITDEHLRCIVAYLNPLYGGKDDMTPAYVHALISVLYIDGSSRFEGGSVLFAETLRKAIESRGGRVIAGDAVTAVHSVGKMITGVSTESGKDFTADRYICAIHPCSFFKLLDDEKLLPKPYMTRLNELPNSYSAFTLNLKLKPGSFKYFNYTMYYMSRYDAVWSFGETDQWPCGFLFITPPELNQGEYATKIIVTAPMQWKAVKRWENTTVGMRGSEYEAWKEKCTERLLDCMEDVYPSFRNCIEAVNSASPLTIRDFYGVKEGSMYGFSKDCYNLVLSQVPVVTKVPNLLLTGQNCNLHGFCGVALTAINTCEAILGRNYILNKINRFNDIRPYFESEIYDAMQRIAASPALDKVMELLFPGQDVESVKGQIRRIVRVGDFQQQMVFPAVGRILERICTGFDSEGLERLDPAKRYLFVTGRPIDLLDALLLSYAMIQKGFDSPEIPVAAKLLQDGFMADLLKSNKMYLCEGAPELLSDYISTTLSQKQQSIVSDRDGGSVPAGITVVPVAITYEKEKRVVQGDGLDSVLASILQQRGKIHISFGTPVIR